MAPYRYPGCETGQGWTKTVLKGPYRALNKAMQYALIRPLQRPLERSLKTLQRRCKNMCKPVNQLQKAFGGLLRAFARRDLVEENFCPNCHLNASLGFYCRRQDLDIWMEC